jgi:hypothetical protein
MKRLLFGSIALLCASGIAVAQQAAYVYTPLSYQQISVTSAAAVSLTIPTSASNVRLIEVCLDANQIRYRDDGNAPTTTTGMPVVQSLTPCFPYSGNISQIQFIAINTATTLNISYYR